MRFGAFFISICMLLIAGSAGATAYLGFGFAPTEAITVALAVLTALVLYNMFSTRLGVRAVVGSQLTDISRGNADMARQVAEIGRRLAAVEGRVESALTRTRAAAEPLAVEIGDLGTLVRQLAESVAAHETKLTEIAQRPPASAPFSTPAADQVPLVETAAPAVSPEPEPVIAAVPAIVEDDRLPLIRSAIDANRIDLYLQPVVALPQRKVRYYEAMSRLRTEQGDTLQASDFVPLAEAGGLMPKIDNLVVFRCVQVVRRLLLKNRDIGLFCNLSISTLSDTAVFSQLLDFLEANRAIAPSLVLEFTQSALRAAGPMENEGLATLAERGFRFSLDNLQDLRIEPRELATRGFRFIKVPGSLLLNRNDTASDIHPADLSDLLGRFGIDLIAERIENEGMVVDLLDYDVRFGQGFLFSPPRPVRAEALQGVADRADVAVRDRAPPPEPSVGVEASGREPAPADAGNGRRGLAQLARGVVSRN
jgi:cyclic-di-GMP phosphodiesterase TipF (flagellum assembly factor)